MAFSIFFLVAYFTLSGFFKALDIVAIDTFVIADNSFKVGLASIIQFYFMF